MRQAGQRSGGCGRAGEWGGSLKTKDCHGIAVSLRPARVPDSSLLLAWTNVLRACGLGLSGSRPLEFDEHETWFAARLECPDSWIWIVERAGTPVGVVRLEREAGTSADTVGVSAFMEQEGRRQGLASAAIECALRKVALEQGVSRAIARVRPENAASRRLFEGLGFTAAERSADHVVLHRRVGT